MKYVIFKQGEILHPVLFADHTTHRQVTLAGGIPVSGGFVDLDCVWPKCYGKAESLGLTPNPGDSEIIQKWRTNRETSAFLTED